MRTLEEVRAFFAKDRFALETCGITIDEAGDGRAVCTMPLEERHLNANNVAQGGAIFTLADICFTVAANVGEIMTVSHSAEIHYLRPGTGRFLRAEASRISEGRTTCLYRVDIFNDEGKLIAFATGTGFRVQRSSVNNA